MKGVSPGQQQDKSHHGVQILVVADDSVGGCLNWLAVEMKKLRRLEVLNLL